MSDDQAECFGGRIDYAHEAESASASVGAEYLNSLADADALETFISDNGLKVTGKTGAYAVHAKTNLGPVDLMGEVVSATGRLRFTEVEGGTPLAWYVEAGYRFSVLDKEAVAGVSYQASDNLVGFLPESRIMGTVGIAFHESVTTSLEYAHDKDYNVASGGTNNGADAVTLHLSLSF